MVETSLIRRRLVSGARNVSDSLDAVDAFAVSEGRFS
jgi:hypothetical protein